eukprot:CAMPEP_0182523198 /NCGR_PEP_ID=MMETSP1323-20130603/870_1 /TAXON_ID=236787 /ORGANISM="Florenciella parvula, Strain RCC1693" /LENGTH=73 /DNA_ID=CAMNT_0024731503 /DNA_START=68 /DNA_END=289 /DNA_ORIENTATION=+
MSGGDQRSAEALDVLHEISGLLNTGLDKNSLSILVQLCEMGVNPGALIHVVQELRREGAARAEESVAGGLTLD